MEPTCPVPPSASVVPPVTAITAAVSIVKRGWEKKPKEKAVRPSKHCTLEQADGWVPPPPPAPFKSYHLPRFDACQIIYPGANHDPWWDMSQLIAQPEDAIRIFNSMYPEGIVVFIFDCSSAHEAFADDVLIAHKMNKSPGGKQPRVHDTIIPATGQPQSMVFLDNMGEKDANGASLAGKPKGMEQVFQERGLLDTIPHGPHVPLAVCVTCKMSQEARDKAT